MMGNQLWELFWWERRNGRDRLTPVAAMRPAFPAKLSVAAEQDWRP